MIPVFLPLAASVLPIFVLARIERRPVKRPYLWCAASFSCCLAAVCMEVYTVLRRTAAVDFGGIEDTIGAVLIICIIISVITALLNLLALTASYGDQSAEGK